jgi:hypothetical protein
VFLTPTRPGTTETLFVWDRPKYIKMIDVCKTVDEFRPETDWDLMRQLSGFSGSVTSVLYVENPKTQPHEHQTISNLAMRSLNRATGYQDPDCVGCGFAYACEYALTRKVLVHYVSYRLNEARFGPDWPAEARKLLAARQLTEWDHLFRKELRDFVAADHVSSFAAVSYLFRTDPRKFVLFCLALKNKEEATPALERVYGKPLKALEADCLKGVARGG